MSIDYLKNLNAHPRDAHISFEEGPHIYTVHGERGKYTSVTTWNHSHFAHFDADKVIQNMKKSKKWDDPNANKYYGMTDEQIKQAWDENRDQAANAGTKMHADIEHYYNQMPVTNTSIEYQFFQKFLKDFPELKPYRTEWMIYCEEIKLSGSVDMVYENPDGTLLIYDWKRCKEIRYEDEFGNTTATTECIQHVPDTNFWHYALQLNTYRMILEKKYDKKVVGLFLICLHPDNPYKTYDRIEIPFMDKEMEDLYNLRLSIVENAKQTQTQKNKPSQKST
jgi:ATP-dependent exoDNAse (exonuclease V) beta subunit